MLKKESQAETEVDSKQKPIAGSSSPNAAKPNVGCCTFLKTAMQEFLRWYKDPNGLYFPSEIDDKINEFLEIEKQQIVDAFKAGILNANYSSVPSDEIDDNANEYFNNTFKK